MKDELNESLKMYSDIVDGAERDFKPVVLTTDEREEIIDAQLALVINQEKDSLIRIAIANASPLLSEYSESQIRTMAGATETDQMLRVSFWEEVAKCLRDNRNIVETEVFKGICNVSYWSKLKTPEYSHKFAYILSPVKEYGRMNKVLLAQGQQVLLDILNASPYVGTGKDRKLDARIAKVQLEAYRLVEERLYGKAVQRIQQHNLNEHAPRETFDVDSLKEEIRQLEASHMDLLVANNDELSE